MIIRVLDFEATEFADKGGRICEVGQCDLIGAGQSWEAQPPLAYLVNPGTPIPSTASAVHHIVDSDVAGAPAFDVQALLIPPALGVGVNATGPDVFAAHSAAKAERLYLANEKAWPAVTGIPWICTYKCSMWHWPDAAGHSVGALRYELGLVPLDERREARFGHNGAQDAWVTAHLLRRLLIEVPVAQLFEWSERPVLQKTCRIGDWHGRLWAEVDSGMMHWILGKDFDEDVRFTCQHHLRLREEERARAAFEAGEGPDPITAVVMEQRGQERLL